MAEPRSTYPDPPPMWKDTSLHQSPPPLPEDGKWILFGEPQTMNYTSMALPNGVPDFAEGSATDIDALKVLVQRFKRQVVDIVKAYRGEKDFGAQNMDLKYLLVNLHLRCGRLRAAEARLEILRAMEAEAERKRNIIEELRKSRDAIRDSLRTASLMVTPGAAETASGAAAERGMLEEEDEQV